VPLVGAVTCGAPVLAEENIQALYSCINRASQERVQNIFYCERSGDSMNLAGINSGDLLLIRQQDTAEENDKVVALINDEATVKVFQESEWCCCASTKVNEQRPQADYINR
jgi:repressor LexA